MRQIRFNLIIQSSEFKLNSKSFMKMIFKVADIELIEDIINPELISGLYVFQIRSLKIKSIEKYLATHIDKVKILFSHENICYTIFNKFFYKYYHILPIRILLYLLGGYKELFNKRPYSFIYIFIARILIKKSKDFFIISSFHFHRRIFKYPYHIFFYHKFRESELQKANFNRDLGKDRRKFCAFVVSNPSNKERIKFFKKLSKYKKVDSFGRVLNNSSFPKEILDKYSNKCSESSISNRYESCIELFKQYKFVICFENSYHYNYITEKILHPIISGTIPIYAGAPNVGDYFNTKSFINYGDYKSYDKMIEKVIELDQDDQKYEAFIKQKIFKEGLVEDIEKEIKRFCNAVYDEVQKRKKTASSKEV